MLAMFMLTDTTVETAHMCNLTTAQHPTELAMTIIVQGEMSIHTRANGEHTLGIGNTGAATLGTMATGRMGVRGDQGITSLDGNSTN